MFAKPLVGSDFILANAHRIWTGNEHGRADVTKCLPVGCEGLKIGINVGSKQLHVVLPADVYHRGQIFLILDRRNLKRTIRGMYRRRRTRCVGSDDLAGQVQMAERCTKCIEALNTMPSTRKKDVHSMADIPISVLPESFIVIWTPKPVTTATKCFVDLHVRSITIDSNGSYRLRTLNAALGPCNHKPAARR